MRTSARPFPRRQGLSALLVALSALLCLLPGALACANPEAHWRHHVQALSQSFDLEALPHLYALRPLEPWLDADQVLADLHHLGSDPGLHPVVRAHLQQHLALHWMQHQQPQRADALTQQTGALTRWALQGAPAQAWRDLSGMDFAGYTSLRPWLPLGEARQVWLQTTVRAGLPQRTHLLMSAEGGYRIWLNGRPLGQQAHAQAASMDRDQWELPLRRGDNEISILLDSPAAGASGLYARLVDSGGRPLLLPSRPLEAQPPLATTSSAQRPAAGPALGLLQRGPAAPHSPSQQALLAWMGQQLYQEQARPLWKELAQRALEGLSQEGPQRAEPASRAYALLLLSQLEPGLEPWRVIWRAHRLAPEDRWVAWSLAASLLEGQGAARVPEALQILRRLEQGPEPFWGAVLLRAQLDSSMGLSEAALVRVEGLAAQRPNTPALWEALADLYQRSQRAPEEAAALRRLLGFRATLGSRRARLAALLLDAGDQAGALRTLEQGIALAPEAHGLAAMRARSLEDAGRLEEALEQWRALLARRPQDAQTLLALASTEQRAGQAQQARLHQEQALALAPDNAALRAQLEARGVAQRPEEALLLPPDDPRLRPPRHLTPESPELLILARQTLTRLLPDGARESLHQRVVAPLRPSGVPRASTLVIPHQAQGEQVELLRLRVQPADGPAHSRHQLQERHPDASQSPLYQELAQTVIHIQGVQPGDVVEVQWRVRRRAWASPVPFSELLYLQEPWPVRFSRFALYSPEGASTEAHWGARQTSGALLTRRRALPGQPLLLEVYHLPALAPEASMPGLAEISAHLHLTSFTSWEALARWYGDFAAPQMRADGPLQEQVRRLSDGLTQERARVAGLHAFVAGQIRYQGLELGVHSYLPYPAPETLRRGFGDCKDQAALLHTMLQQAGIPSHLVLVRTRRLGHLQALAPSLRAFDHVILYLPSLDLYLDPTSPHHGLGSLPERLQGADALVIAPQTQQPTRLPSSTAEEHQERWRLAVDLRPSSPTWEAQLVATGQAAADWRAALSQHSPQALLRLPQPQLEITQAQVQGAALPASELELQWRGQGGQPLQARGSRRHLLPAATPVHLVDHWAPEHQRQQDRLTQGPRQRSTYTAWTLPQGARLAEGVPRRLGGQSRFGAWSVQLEPQGEQLLVHAAWTLTPHRVAQEDYAAFRDFVIQMERGLNTPLWLEGGAP